MKMNIIIILVYIKLYKILLLIQSNNKYLYVCTSTTYSWWRKMLNAQTKSIWKYNKINFNIRNYYKFCKLCKLFGILISLHTSTIKYAGTRCYGLCYENILKLLYIYLLHMQLSIIYYIYVENAATVTQNIHLNCLRKVHFNKRLYPDSMHSMLSLLCANRITI